MSTDSIVKDLESIVNKGLESSFLPLVRGNSIRIKNYVIRHNTKKGYLIYNTENNTQVAKTEFKSSAVAIAKTLASGRNIVDTILSYDTELVKHYNDAIFYKHIITTTDDPVVKDIRRARFDISVEESRLIRGKIDKYIFSF